MEPVGAGEPVAPLTATIAVRGCAVVTVDADRLRLIVGTACSAVRATRLEVLAE